MGMIELLQGRKEVKETGEGTELRNRKVYIYTRLHPLWLSHLGNRLYPTKKSSPASSVPRPSGGRANVITSIST